MTRVSRQSPLPRLLCVLLSTIFLLALQGCAPMTPSSSSGGGPGPVEWRIEDPKVQVEPGRTKWQYIIKLRDTSGNGVHFDKVARKVSGPDVTASTTEWPIDVTIEPGGEVRIPCWDSVTTRASAAGGTYNLLNLSKTFSGLDGKGKPVQIQVEYELHTFMPPRKPVMLEFALMTAESTATRRLLCEAIPKQTIVFDPSRHDFVYLLIGIENVRRRVPARTRWINPLGEEVKVVTSEIDAESIDRISAFVHITHSLATSVMRSRPGEWKVELYLDGKLEGTYRFEVLAPGSVPAPRRL